MGIEWRLAPRIEVEQRLCLGELFQLEKEHNEFITKENQDRILGPNTQQHVLR